MWEKYVCSINILVSHNELVEMWEECVWSINILVLHNELEMWEECVWSINILVLHNELEWWEGYAFLLKGVVDMRSAQPGVLNKRRIPHPVSNVT